MTKPAGWQDKLIDDVKNLQIRVKRLENETTTQRWVNTVLEHFEQRLKTPESKIAAEGIKKSPYLEDPMRPRVALESEIRNNMKGNAELYDIRRLLALGLDILLDIRDLLTPEETKRPPRSL